MTHAEAPLSVNFKPAAGYDAPMITVRANDPVELKTYLEGIAGAGILESVNTLDGQFKAAYGTPSGGAQNVQNVLGGQQAAVAPAPTPAAAPAASGWGQQAAAPAQQWGQQAAAAPAAAPAAASAGAPFIAAFGQAAVFRSGQSARGPWSAYMDPRPKQVTDNLPKDHTGKVPTTDNENDPGLAAGTHKFTKFIR